MLFLTRSILVFTFSFNFAAKKTVVFESLLKTFRHEWIKFGHFRVILEALWKLYAAGNCGMHYVYFYLFKFTAVYGIFCVYQVFFNFEVFKFIICTMLILNWGTLRKLFLLVQKSLVKKSHLISTSLFSDRRFFKVNTIFRPTPNI